jgi:uncharacterized membrane protein YedE/YeeE
VRWELVAIGFLVALAGVVGGSARKGDRLGDIPAVFARAPVRNLAVAGGVAFGVALVLALRF